jgi:hypothetical protein
LTRAVIDPNKLQISFKQHLNSAYLPAKKKLSQNQFCFFIAKITKYYFVYRFVVAAAGK